MADEHAGVHAQNVTYHKCRCGHPACSQYTLSTQGGVGFDLADARLYAAASDLLSACQEFVRKVDAGEARSTRSYKQMKAAITKATQA